MDKVTGGLNKEMTQWILLCNS